MGTGRQRDKQHLPVVLGVRRRPGSRPWVLLLARLRVHAPNLHPLMSAVLRQFFLALLNDLAVCLAPAVKENDDVILMALRGEELHDALEPDRVREAEQEAGP